MIFDTARPALMARMQRGEALSLCWLATGSLPVAEAAAGSRPDAVVLDLQHGLWDRMTTEAVIGVLSPRVPVLARVADDGAAAIGAALDAGAEGVIVPLIETADQAAKAVAASRFPPGGIRSAGGNRPLADLGAYLDWARSHVLCAVMIETRRGLDAVDEIAAVPGLDMVFIGTGDLSLSLGCAPDDPALDKACDRIKSACHASGLPCGIFTSDAAAARAMRASGFAMAVVASDVSLLKSGFAQAHDVWNRPEETGP